MKPTLVIRANASESIGHGHVMRCLALAQSWQELVGPALYVLNSQADTLQEKLQQQGIRTVFIDAALGSDEDARQTLAIAEAEFGQAIIADGYEFDAQYQRLLTESKRPLLVLDDYGHAGHYAADLVVNQNAGPETSLYDNCGEQTKLLLGPKYALLRKEFTECTRQCESKPVSQKDQSINVLITTGGVGDPATTEKILQALKLIDWQEQQLAVRLVLGRHKAHNYLLELVKTVPGKVAVHEVISDMPEAMNWADVAITAGGTTLWELAFSGVPAIAIILSENQRQQVEHLAQRDVLISAGWHEDLRPAQLAAVLGGLVSNAALRSAMSSNGRRLVDGKGARRVIQALQLELKIR